MLKHIARKARDETGSDGYKLRALEATVEILDELAQGLLNFLAQGMRSSRYARQPEHVEAGSNLFDASLAAMIE